MPLARLRPNDPTIVLNLAIARLKTRHLALAQRAFATFGKLGRLNPAIGCLQA